MFNLLFKTRNTQGKEDLAPAPFPTIQRIPSRTFRINRPSTCLFVFYLSRECVAIVICHLHRPLSEKRRRYLFWPPSSQILKSITCLSFLLFFDRLANIEYEVYDETKIVDRTTRCQQRSFSGIFDHRLFTYSVAR